jgi:hypothetical protein
VIIPALLKLKPAGNLPDGTVHEYGAVPPVAGSIAEYGVPTVPPGGIAALITNPLSGFTLIERAACAISGGVEASETCPVKLNWPVAVGVPLIPPLVLDNDNPAGNAPDITLNVYGAVPPTTSKVPT